MTLVKANLWHAVKLEKFNHRCHFQELKIKDASEVMVFIAKSLDQAKKSHGSDYTVAQILLISWGYMRTKTRNYESTTQVWASIG